jgi:hypothetical protein
LNIGFYLLFGFCFLGFTNASASISTNISGEMSRLTSTMLNLFNGAGAAQAFERLNERIHESVVSWDFDFCHRQILFVKIRAIRG